MDLQSPVHRLADRGKHAQRKGRRAGEGRTFLETVTVGITGIYDEQSLVGVSRAAKQQLAANLVRSTPLGPRPLLDDGEFQEWKRALSSLT